MKRTLLILATACLLTPLSPAAVIYDNGGPLATDGNETTQWVQTDDFGIAGGSSIVSAGVYIGAAVPSLLAAWDGTLDYFVFADAVGSPGGMLASGAGLNVTTTEIGPSFAGGDNIYLFEFDFASPFAAAASTTYWFGIHLSTNFDRDEIYWVASGPGNGNESQNGTFDNWSSNGNARAFYLSDTPGGVSDVPEPTTISLLGASLLGLMWVRRKKSN